MIARLVESDDFSNLYGKILKNSALYRIRERLQEYIAGIDLRAIVMDNKKAQKLAKNRKNGSCDSFLYTNGSMGVFFLTEEYLCYTVSQWFKDSEEPPTNHVIVHRKTKMPQSFNGVNEFYGILTRSRSCTPAQAEKKVRLLLRKIMNGASPHDIWITAGKDQ